MAGYTKTQCQDTGHRWERNQGQWLQVLTSKGEAQDLSLSLVEWGGACSPDTSQLTVRN